MGCRGFGIGVVAGVLIAAMAGCAPTAGDGGAPSSPPASTPSSGPTSSEAPSSEPDPGDPSSWIISDAGVGPIEIGGDFAAALAELPETWSNDTANCSWSAWWNADDAHYGIFFVRGTESETAPISEISVYTAAETPSDVEGPVTRDGLGIAATEEEILAAYPDAQKGAAQIGGGTWIMLPGDGDAHVFFEYREGVDAASDVVVTTRSEPSYEVCG